jgi:transcription elongation factor GreA
MSQISYYSAEGLKKLKDEMRQLETVERPFIIQQIADARDKGDLSENAEYHAAKEEQGLLETRIAKLSVIISNARIMDDSNLDTSKVLVLSIVKLKNVANSAVVEYRLVAPNEADIKAKKISIESPYGKGLMGKSVGDIVDITVPNGVMKFEILEINR